MAERSQLVDPRHPLKNAPASALALQVTIQITANQQPSTRFISPNSTIMINNFSSNYISNAAENFNRGINETVSELMTELIVSRNHVGLARLSEEHPTIAAHFCIDYAESHPREVAAMFHNKSVVENCSDAVNKLVTAERKKSLCVLIINSGHSIECKNEHLRFELQEHVNKNNEINDKKWSDREKRESMTRATS